MSLGNPLLSELPFIHLQMKTAALFSSKGIPKKGKRETLEANVHVTVQTHCAGIAKPEVAGRSGSGHAL